jgi:hypothetical protein
MLSEFEMLEVLINLMASYPSYQPKVEVGEMVKAYQRALADQAPATVRRAGLWIVTTEKYFPSAFELRAAAEAVAVELHGRGIDMGKLSDAAQRWQDEIYGFAAPLLSKEPDPVEKWSAREIAEFARLTGKAPRKLGEPTNRGVFEAYGRWVRMHPEEVEVMG